MKKEIALTIPGISSDGRVGGIPFMRPELSGGTAGSIISEFLNLAFLIAGIMMFLWFTWGAFAYIFAQGDKNGLAKARSRMVWSIMGFIMIIISFLVSQYVQGIIPTENNRLERLQGPAQGRSGAGGDVQ